MNPQVKDYIDKYSKEIVDIYLELRQMVFDSVSCKPKEELWAKLPSYYVGAAFVRLIPFKDHVNIEVRQVIKYKEELKGYKITPKGMLQIYVNQNIPKEVLTLVFSETLTGQ